MADTYPLTQLVKVSRAKILCDGEAFRIVYHSEIVRGTNGLELAKYVADKAPLLYRDASKISEALVDGYFLSSVRETLARLPTAATFQKSHFAEIACAIFAEEVMGLVRLYSKLSLLTAENANAFKMDLVLCDPKCDPLEFVFAEVKSSTKTRSPAKHHRGCFKELFSTFDDYGDSDKEFDLAAAKDRISLLPSELRQRVHAALLPYANSTIRYVGFAVVDTKTYLDSEVEVLSTRNHSKTFDVDLICVESLGDVSQETYKILEQVRAACSP